MNLPTDGTPEFWGPSRVLIRDRESWSVIDWPGLSTSRTGDGVPIPEPGGDRIVVLTESALHLDGDRLPAQPDGTMPVRTAVWWDRDSLVAHIGARGFGAGEPVSLHPVGDDVTAQEFGTYPADNSSLWAIPLEDDVPRRLLDLSGIDDVLSSMARFGDRLFFTRFRYPMYGGEGSMRILTLDLETGEVEDAFPELEGATSAPVVSPSRDRLAFLHSDVDSEYPFWWELVVRSDAGESRPLPNDLQLAGGTPVWSPDGSQVAVAAQEGLDMSCAVASIGDGPVASWRKVGETGSLIGGFALTVEGEVLRPRSAEAFDSMAPGRFRWERAGVGFEGLLAHPSTPPPWPMVVDVHGGPVGPYLQMQSDQVQIWAAAGFASLAVEHRGSGVAGREEMIRCTHWGDDAARRAMVDDMLAGVDAAVEAGLADPRQLYLFGYSHGAYLVNEVVGVDHRFNAAVAYEGFADIRLMYSRAWGGGGLASLRRAVIGATPWERPDLYDAASPITRVSEVQTPLLLLHGETGLKGGIAWYTALRAHGVDTKLVVYAGEGHAMANPRNKEDLYARSIDWFESHPGG